MRCLSEILLEQPRDGVLWRWYPTMKSHPGAGVSNLIEYIITITLPFSPHPFNI